MTSILSIPHLAHLLIRTLLLVVAMLLAAGNQAQARRNITPDNSGIGTRVRQDGNAYFIEGGKLRGKNLFHSFGRFGLDTDESGTFLGANWIRNIIARVTGGQRSDIDGLIRSEIPGANLFLINPSGVMFGPNATLDVSGSFHVSTADYLKFTDGKKFYADPSMPTKLSMAPVAAFGFLSANPARIDIQGSRLVVDPGKTLSVVGGDLSITGATLAAPDGRIQLGSVASAEEATLGPDLNVDSFASLGKIDISGNSLIGARDADGNGGGVVLIRGGQLMVDNSKILANRLAGDVSGDRLIDLQVRGDIILTNSTSILSQTTVDARDASGGNINVTAGSLKILQGSVMQTTIANPNGEGGHISVDVRELDLRGGGRIVSSSLAGRGGDVTVRARDLIAISGSGSGLLSNVAQQSKGNGGHLKIESPLASLILDDRGSITTRNASNNADARGGDIDIKVKSLGLGGGGEILSRTAKGSGGSVKVAATDTITISGQGSGIRSGSDGLGQTGVIDVEGRTLTLTGGAVIESGSGLDPQGGNVKVKARESLVISNGGRISSQAQSLPVGQLEISAPTLIMDNGFIQASTRAGGRAGDITVNSRNLTMTRGSRIANSSEGTASGDAGNITVNGITGEGSKADSVSISSGSGLFSNTERSGLGGNIAVNAGQVQLTDARISAASTGTGDAGSITINANTLRSRNSRVTTEAENAGGGKIEIKAQKMVHLVKSEVTTAVKRGSEGAGDISIDPQFVIFDRSRISADAFGGPGGNVTIRGDIFLNSHSLITASSALSTPGTINIQASITDVSSALAQLPENVFQASELLRASCAVRLSEGKASSLVLAGREGLPLEPGGLLPSPLLVEEPATITQTKSESYQWEKFIAGPGRPGLAAAGFRIVGSGMASGFSQALLYPACSR